MPMARASRAVAPAVTSPSSSRTGMNSSSGSSRYAPRASGRPLRSATSRSDSRISALNAASIAPRYTATHASRKDTERNHCGRDRARARSMRPSRRPPFRRRRSLDAPHLAGVALVVVAEQMEQAVQRQDPQLGQLRVTRLARLPPGDAAGDHDLPQETLHHRGHGGHGWNNRGVELCVLRVLCGGELRRSGKLNTSVA